MSVKNAASVTIHLLLKNERHLHFHTVLRDLPFVIGRTPAVQGSVVNRRLKWRGLPLVKRVLRLDIVVSINQHGGPLWSCVQVFSIYNRMPAFPLRHHVDGGHDLDMFHAKSLQVIGHPFGGTGIRQAMEVTRQLRGDAIQQVPGAAIGLTHNLSGFIAAHTVLIYGREVA